MLRTTIFAGSLGLTYLTAGTAAADVDATTVAPIRFPSLAPDGLRSELTGRLGLHFFDAGEATETAVSLALDGQFVTPAGAGGYARLGGATYDDATGIGDLEVGALYRIDQSPGTAITLRGGLTLPTASDDLDDYLTNTVTIFAARPSDLIQAPPDITALRLAVAPTYRTGIVTLRADVGIDIVLDEPGDYDDGYGPLLHADLGIGLQHGHLGGTIELATLISTDDKDDGALHALTLGGQLQITDTTAVTAALAFPFTTGDHSFYDEFDAISVMLGVSGGL